MNKPFSIVARDKHGVSKAIRILQNFSPTDNSPIEVLIQPYKKNRSQQQNKLYWKWLTIIGEELGQKPEETAEDMKRKFLKPMLEATDDKFRDILHKLRSAYRDGHEELAVSLEQYVMSEASTSMLNTKQMTDYLERILEHANELDIKLPIPEDRRRL